MQNIFIDILPPWVETGLQPAFYDLESGTVLQQTARMYAKVRELTKAFNDFSEAVTNEVNTFETNVTNTVNDYIQRFNELYTYVHDYFDNLDVQEEINNKIDNMVESGDFQQIVGTYLGIVTPQMFGAVSGTDDDQAKAISDCLEYAFEHGIKNVYLDGDYFVDTKITFTGKADIAIKNGTIRVHETSEKLADGFKVFGFTNCSNINFENVRIIETDPEERTRNLYQGGIYFTGCTNCSVKGCYFENTHNGVTFKTGNTDCIAENNEIYVNQHSAQFAESAILSYGSDDIIIKNNKVTGEFYDGTISVYGGSDNNIVDGNIVVGIFDNSPIWLSEGITVDAACDNTIVVNNNVFGQWYGIDNKNDSRNTLIANNSVRGCKVAITDRPGEENKQTFNCQIKDNQIIIQKTWDTSGSLANTLFEELYYYVGIYCGQRISADVKSNKITIWKTIDQKTVCGILCTGNTTTTTNMYFSPFEVHNNVIEFATGFGSDTGVAGSNSCGIYYKNILKGSISGNSLKLDMPANTYTMIMFAGDNTYIEVTNNNYFAVSTVNHAFVALAENATVSKSKVVNNNLNRCKGRFNLENITNVVEMPYYQVQGHQIATTNLTYNVWKTVATINPEYASNVRLKIKAVRSDNGNKYLFGEYIINIAADAVTLLNTPDEYASGLEVQFVHGANSKDCDIQIRANTGMSNFGMLFITDIMSEQVLTFS